MSMQDEFHAKAGKLVLDLEPISLNKRCPQCALLQEHLAVDEKLLAHRDQLLAAIPPCPVHGGGCVSHALEWVQAARNGWVVADGKEPSSFRFVNNDQGGLTDWTLDPDKALRFARREDAEQFAHHDEDAWRIMAAAGALPPPAWITGLLETAEHAYEAAAKVTGSALLAGETPKARMAEQRRLVYVSATEALRDLFCIVDELKKRAAQ